MNRHLCFYRVLIATLLLLIFGGLHADIVVMKSGDKKIGKIIAEDEVSVTLQFQLTAKITDSVKIPKADISEITRETPAQSEFRENELVRLVPSRDLMTASDYEAVIQDKLRTFVAKYPDAPEAAQVKDIIAVYQEERERVLDGQVKVDGKWVRVRTALPDKNEIEAYRLRLAMRKEMADVSKDATLPKEINALREFDRLRTGFPASLQYCKAIPDALEILDKYEKRLKQMEVNQPILSSALPGKGSWGWSQDLLYRINAISQEERDFRERFEKQTRDKVKWRDVYPYDMRSIQLAQAAVTKERKELGSIDLPALETENKDLSAVKACIADGRLAEAESIMARLRCAKDTLINKDVFDELEKRVKELQGR